MTSPRGEGVELAKGYISLSVKYGSAMSQVQNDFARVEGSASAAGTAAGRAHAEAMGKTMQTEGMRQAHSALSYVAAKSEAGLKVTGRDWGRALANDMSSEFGRVVGSGMEKTLRGFSGLNTPTNAARQLRSSLDELATATAGVTSSQRLLNAAKSSGNDAAIAQETVRMAAARGMEAEALKRSKNTYSEWVSVTKGYSVTGAIEAGFGRMASKARSALGDVREGFSSMAEHGRSAIESLAAPITGMISGPMAGLLAALTTIGGGFEILKMGYERLETIEQARAKLEALGHSASEVNAVMNSAQAAIKGTMYSIQDVTGVAQRAFLQGIKPGQELTDYLKVVANAAAASGQSMDSVSAQMDRLRTRGSATMREMTTYTRMGLPMATWIKQDLNLSDKQFADFVKHHRVTYQLFMDEIAKHGAGVADKMAHTLSAQIHILQNNLSAIGAAVLEPFMESGAQGVGTLNDKLQHFSEWLEEHQPEIVQFFADVAVAIETMAAKGIEGLGKLSGGLGKILSGISHIPGLRFAVGEEGVKALGDAANALQGFEGQAQSWGQTIEGTVIPATQRWGERVKTAVEFHQALRDKVDKTKEAVAELNHEGGLEIKDATPSIINNLKELGVHLRQIGDDPTHLEILADTDKAVEIINQLREKEGKEPLKLPTSADTQPAKDAIKNLQDELKNSPLQVPYTLMTGGLQPGMPGSPGTSPPDEVPQAGGPGGIPWPQYGPISPPSQPTPGNKVWVEPEKHGNPPPDAPDLPPGLDYGNARWDAEHHRWMAVAGRAFGGITYGVRSFASGGLPDRAIIQPAMPGRGLVQWAEPETGGESFIPLHPAKRERSIEIWKQTGSLLGVGGHYGMYSDKKWSGTGGKMDRGGGNGLADGGIRSAAQGFIFGGQYMPGMPNATGGGMDSVNSLLIRLTGGAGGQRTPYSMGGFSPTGIDCSGVVSAVVNSYMGMSPFSSRMDTTSEMEWLSKRGFRSGVGPAGSLSVAWYDHGGGGAGHTALTLPNGLNVESTTSNGISGVRVGSLAAGGYAAEFDRHAYLPAGVSGVGGFGMGGAFGGFGGGGVPGGRFGGGMGMPTGGGFGGGGAFASPAGFGGGGGAPFPLAPGGGGGGAGGGGGGGGPNLAGSSGSPPISGPAPGVPTGGAPTAAGGLGGITDPVAAIVAEGRRRGYSDEQISWIVADAIGESGLSPAARNGDHIGLFQQDAGYPGRNTLGGQVTGFYDRLDKTDPNMPIGDRISRTPAQGGVEGGGYGPDWIQAHLGEARSRIAGVGSGATPLGSGQGRRGGPKPITSQQQEAEDKKERELNDKITDLNNDIQEAQDQLGEMTSPDRDTPAKPYEVSRAQTRLERLKRELGEAKADLQTTQTDFGQKSQAGMLGGGAGGEGGGGLLSLLGESNLESLGDIGSSAMMSFLPPGFINPFGTTAMHAGSVIFNFLGALMSGKGSNVVRSITGGGGLQSSAGMMPGGGSFPVGVNAAGQMVPLGQMPAAAAAYSGGGGGPTVDASQHFEGASFGHDINAVNPVIQNAKSATMRAVGTIDSQRIWNT